MFPLLRNSAARALDVAIEFATLGEYRLADPVAPGAPARGATRRAVPAERPSGAPARPAARLVAPASAAAVRLRPAASPAIAAGPTRSRPAPPAPAVGPVRSRPMPPAPAVAASELGRLRAKPAPVQEGAMRQLALGFAGTVPTPPVRSRGGAAAPAPQPCESARR